MAPLAPTWIRLCFGLPLGNFLRTPLAQRLSARNEHALHFVQNL